MLEAEAAKEGPTYLHGKSNGNMNGWRKAQIASRLKKVTTQLYAGTEVKRQL